MIQCWTLLWQWQQHQAVTQLSWEGLSEPEEMEQPFGLGRLSCTWAALHPCARQCWPLVVPKSAVPVTKKQLPGAGLRFGAELSPAHSCPQTGYVVGRILQSKWGYLSPAGAPGIIEVEWGIFIYLSSVSSPLDCWEAAGYSIHGAWGVPGSCLGSWCSMQGSRAAFVQPEHH